MIHPAPPLLALALLLASAASAQDPSLPPVRTHALSYSDVADLALAAPIAAAVTVRKATRLKGPSAAGLAPGRVRFLLTGDVDALLAAREALPARISWLADVPLTEANRPPRLAKQRLLLLARPVPGKPDAVQLVSPAAQIGWTPQGEQRLRDILTAKLAADAPPQITGIGHAFHVPGSIPGEGETQVFLRTADGRPVSLGILRRPGEQPRWSVSLGEIVSDAAAAPAPDTLLWYRLACGLPPALPDEAVGDQSPEDAAQARADYKLVVDALGACGRTLPAT